jgi:tetratricopeptide (TPR) repeat protein
VAPERDLEAETAARTARAHAQRAAKAAEDAAETARQRAEDVVPPAGAPIRVLTIEAARDAARAAADAAWRASQEAAQAETAAQMAIGGGGQARNTAVAASARAEDAALQALEAAEESKDRPRWIAPAMAAPPPEMTGFFGGWRRATRSQSAFVEGKGRYSAEDYRGARERFGEAVMLDPDHDEARALLGWAEYFDGDHAAAGITFKTLLRRQPAWEGLYDGLGWSRLRAGRPRLAREAYRAALAIEPEYLDALIGLGSAEFELRRYGEALPPLTTALRRLRPLVGEDPPQASRVQAKVAWSLYHLSRHEEALAAFEAGVRAGRDVHLFHAGMGWCYLRLQRVAEARAAFERALTLEPGYRDALDGLRLTRR